MGTLTASWTYYSIEVNSTVIHGEKGTLYIGTDPSYGMVVRYSSGRRELYEWEEMQTNRSEALDNSGVIDHFVDGILSGEGHSINGEDGLKALEIILAGADSAKRKQTITL